jgi:Predicted ATPase
MLLTTINSNKQYDNFKEEYKTDSYDPKSYAIMMKEGAIDSFLLYLQENNYCLINDPQFGAVLYDANHQKSYSFNSFDLPFRHWKQVNKIRTNVKFDEELREKIKDSVPTILHQGFFPSAPAPFFKNNNIPHLNYFRPFADAVADYRSTGDISLWLEFMERLFPDQEERLYVQRFLSHMICKPEERPTFGLMLTSEAGTGKGVLFQILTVLLNKQITQCNTFDQFTNQYSSALFNNVLCLLDDVVAKTESQMITLRSKITEPYQPFEFKHKQGNCEIRPCFSRIFLFSNQHRPLKLHVDDLRRWYATKYIKHKVSREETAAFIKRLMEWCESGGYADIFEYLTSSYFGFDVKCPVVTETLMDMLGASKTSLESEIEDYIALHPAFGLSAFYEAFSRYPEDVLKSKLIDLGANGISKQIRLLKNHPDPLIRSNERHVYFGDRQAAVDYLAAKAQQPY